MTIGGLALSIYTYYNYNIGTFSNIGTGMFPVLLGIILSVFGFITAASSIGRSGNLEIVNTIPLLLILLSIGVFAYLSARIGLFPASVVSIFVATLADRDFRIVRSIILCMILSAAASFLFIYGLGVPIPIVRNPF